MSKQISGHKYITKLTQLTQKINHHKGVNRFLHELGRYCQDPSSAGEVSRELEIIFDFILKD